MALIHTDAELTPGKLDLLSGWVPEQAWGAPGELHRVATFRFDDPAGEVGIESLLLRVGGQLLHVPLTYRGSPMADGTLVGEMEHSELGHRWVYDAATDPVYLSVVTTVIVSEGHEAPLTAADGSLLPTPATAASVRGSGLAGPATGPVEVLRRVPGPAAPAAGTLTATWAGQDRPVVLVRLAEGLRLSTRRDITNS